MDCFAGVQRLPGYSQQLKFGETADEATEAGSLVTECHIAGGSGVSDRGAARLLPPPPHGYQHTMAPANEMQQSAGLFSSGSCQRVLHVSAFAAALLVLEPLVAPWPGAFDSHICLYVR